MLSVPGVHDHLLDLSYARIHKNCSSKSVSMFNQQIMIMLTKPYVKPCTGKLYPWQKGIKGLVEAAQ